ncbi:hypothetical protein E4U27_006259 [Claviceps purpurea]|nr:hypothetical protein E4U37_001887 [Claviceps purpurea]KAG6175452.1 hypothetical protein E4U27_006259 [Claviceps purpurea]
MADNAESGGDAQITFKVKTSSEHNYTLTMPESATILELKTKLASEDFEKIPIERQRLIYSGRVMKNDDTLGSYNVKHNNTIHMVRSAASNPLPPSSTGASAARTVPDNIAAGTNPNDPLAGLTGARYAGHQINLPGMDVFGPDGGMGPPMDEDRIQRMMSDPNVQQSMNEALSNPQFVDMLIESNPMLRNIPNARDIISSPFMRHMMTNPQMMSQAMRMQRNMRGAESAFPAPGMTDTSPEAAESGDAPSAGDPSQRQNPFMNPFAMPGGLMGGAGGNDGLNVAQMLQALSGTGGGNPFGSSPTPANPGSTDGPQSTTQSSGTHNAQSTTQAAGTDGSQNTQFQNAANPFAALFPFGSQAPQERDPGNPYGMTPEMMQQMMQIIRGGGGNVPNPASPPDTRPPEERYAEQLRQLNDMGFFDFDRNVAALRRSGGNVQGAVEHLLGGMD